MGIHPSANSKKKKRVVKPGIVFVPALQRLMNNQTKTKERLLFHPKKRESEDKNAVVIVKIVPQLGYVLQDLEALVSRRGKQSRGNPMQKILGPIRRKRFSQSTLRQASIRERKGPSLGKTQVKKPHQRSPKRKRINSWCL